MSNNNNTDLTKAAMDQWLLEDNQNKRYMMLRILAQQAGIEEEFLALPMHYFDLMGWDKYLINVLAMGKIRELKRIADKEVPQQKRRWPW